MSFRDPANTLPGLPLLGLGQLQGTPGNFHFSTAVLSCDNIASLQIEAPPGTGSSTKFNLVQVIWYADAAKTISLGSEAHWVPGGSLLGAPAAVILTECKGSYCVVNCGATLGPVGAGLSVYASSAAVIGSARVDGVGSLAVNYAGNKTTNIPINQTVTNDSMSGFGARPGLTVVSKITASGGNTGTTATLTPTYTLLDPLGLVMGTVAGPAITIPAAAASKQTAPLALPSLPPGGINFELDVTYTLNFATAADSFTVGTFVF